jgi:hypothetical protein
MKPLYNFIVIVVLACTAFMAASRHAYGQIDTSILFIAPERVEFPSAEDERPVTRLINLTNKSNKTARFDVKIENYMMMANGDVKRVDNFNYSAEPFLRYTPKRFTLKPNERLAVRVMAQIPKDLPHGDYHTHLLFREIPSPQKEQETLPENQGNAVHFDINTIYGIGVPIVVQNGTLSSRLVLKTADIAKTAEGTWLSTKFQRTGNAEAAGKLSVSHVIPGQEPVTIIAEQLVRLYHEVDMVERKIALPLIKGHQLSGGELVVRLQTDAETDTQEIRIPLK